MRQNCGKRKKHNIIWQFLDNFGEKIQKVKKNTKTVRQYVFNTFYRENATF